jgi:hypothetical protein
MKKLPDKRQLFIFEKNPDKKDKVTVITIHQIHPPI